MLPSKPILEAQFPAKTSDHITMRVSTTFTGYKLMISFMALGLYYTVDTVMAWDKGPQLDKVQHSMHLQPVKISPIQIRLLAQICIFLSETSASVLNISSQGLLISRSFALTTFYVTFSKISKQKKKAINIKINVLKTCICSYAQCHDTEFPLMKCGLKRLETTAPETELIKKLICCLTSTNSEIQDI